MKWRRKSRCISGTWCTCECQCGTGSIKTSYPWIQKKKQTKSYFFSLRNYIRRSRIEKKEAHLAQNTEQNHQQHSASQAVSLIQDHLQLSPPRDSLRGWGIKKTNHSQLSAPWTSTPDLTGRETRPMGLDWKQESPCQARPSTPWHTWIRRWGYQEMCVCVWVGHVTQQTCLPECAKQFSTWVLTVKPQHPNQLLSHQRLKLCILPNYSRDVLRLTATGIIKK